MAKPYLVPRPPPRRIGSVEIVPGPPDQAPFPVEVRVFEEDSWRLLSADIDLRETTENPLRLMTELIMQRPLVPGSLHVTDTRWLAVIVDLDADPICRDDWVTAALDKIFRLADEKRIASIGLPLLGSQYGNLPWRQSLWLTLRLLAKHAAPFPQRIWLITPARRIREIDGILAMTSKCSEENPASQAAGVETGMSQPGPAKR